MWTNVYVLMRTKPFRQIQTSQYDSEQTDEHLEWRAKIWGAQWNHQTNITKTVPQRTTTMTKVEHENGNRILTHFEVWSVFGAVCGRNLFTSLNMTNQMTYPVESVNANLWCLPSGFVVIHVDKGIGKYRRAAISERTSGRWSTRCFGIWTGHFVTRSSPDFQWFIMVLPILVCDFNFNSLLPSSYFVSRAIPQQRRWRPR